MNRLLAVAIAGLLLGCPSALDSEAACSAEYRRRDDADGALRQVAWRKEKACREAGDKACDRLPEHAELERALAEKRRLELAADECIVAWSKARMFGQ